MTKPNEAVEPPHTQGWEVGTSGAVWRKGVLADMVHAPAPGHSQGPAQIEARAHLIAAAPDMARALLAILARVTEAGKALPRERDADAMAAMEDSQVTISTALLRDAFAALRKAKVLP